jgi:tetraprenyl-beta-curcumene synthase
MRGPPVRRLQRVPEPRRSDGVTRTFSRLQLTPGDPAARPRQRSQRAPSLGLVFCSTVARYLTTVLPGVTRELARWRAGAGRIPDPQLRPLALQAISKRGNMEGAALFAVLAPRARRRETVRALVAFQTAYNYLDILAEQPNADATRNARQLHEALLIALDPAAPHPDYYAHHTHSQDGGYLNELVDACRSAFHELPSHDAVASAAWAAVARIVAFQSLNLTREQGGHDELERWARSQTPDASGLHWFQTAAAGGSSLAIHALIATAAIPDVTPVQVAGLQDAYFPWICALHSLLDSLIDVQEDELAGQRNLLSYHGSPRQAAFAMKMLAKRASGAAGRLPDAPRHQVILAAMTAYYLSSPEAATPDARTSAAAVADALGPLLPAALVLFKARRAVARLVHRGYR